MKIRDAFVLLLIGMAIGYWVWGPVLNPTLTNPETEVLEQALIELGEFQPQETTPRDLKEEGAGIEVGDSDMELALDEIALAEDEELAPEDEASPVTNIDPGPEPNTIEQTKVVLTHDLIESLERNLQELKEQIRITQTDRGWFIESILGKTPFQDAGLREGDLILYDLAELGLEDEGLALRLAGVLNSL